VGREDPSAWAAIPKPTPKPKVQLATCHHKKITDFDTYTYSTTALLL